MKTLTAAAFSIAVAGCATAQTESTPQRKGVTFQPVTGEAQARYPFLGPGEYASTREGLEYGHITYNGTDMIVKRGQGLDWCGATGNCSHRFYRQTHNDDYKQVGGVSIPQVDVVSCPGNGDHFMFYGGGGINNPAANIWTLSNNELERLGAIDELSAEAACDLAEQVLGE